VTRSINPRSGWHACFINNAEVPAALCDELRVDRSIPQCIPGHIDMGRRDSALVPRSPLTSLRSTQPPPKIRPSSPTPVAVFTNHPLHHRQWPRSKPHLNSRACFDPSQTVRKGSARTGVCSGAWQGSSRSDPGILRTIPSASPASPEAANIEGVSTFRNASIDCAESSIGDQSRHLYRGDLLPLFTQIRTSDESPQAQAQCV